MTKKCVPKPRDGKLYAEVTKEAKARFRRWPSAYASGWLVREYKARGGTYRNSCPKKAGGLTTWFAEQWVDVCKPSLPACGRPDAGETEAEYRKRYPKCRPLAKAKAMTPAARAKACAKKRAAVTAQPKRSKKVVWVR